MASSTGAAVAVRWAVAVGYTTKASLPTAAPRNSKFLVICLWPEVSQTNSGDRARNQGEVSATYCNGFTLGQVELEV